MKFSALLIPTLKNHRQRKTKLQTLSTEREHFTPPYLVHGGKSHFDSRKAFKTLRHRRRLQIVFRRTYAVQSERSCKPSALRLKAETRSITRPRFFNVGWTDVTLPNPKKLVERDPNLSLLSALFGSFLSWLCSLLSSWFSGFLSSWFR